MTKHLRLTDEEFAALKGRVAGTHKGTGMPKRSQGGHPLDRRESRTAGNDTAQPPPSQSFFIPGALPGLNEIIAAAKVHRGKWNKYADMKRAHGEYIVGLIRAAKLKPMHTVSIEYHWIAPSKKRDKSNIAAAVKFIEDALVEAGVLTNDGWGQVESWTNTFAVDRSAPGVTVTLREVGK